MMLSNRHLKLIQSSFLEIKFELLQVVFHQAIQSYGNKILI